MIEGVIFDYGGTIDSRGVHWSWVIWDGYQKAGVNVSLEQFREAYVMAERELAKVRHILPNDNFHDLLVKKMDIEFGYLVEQGLVDAAEAPEKARAVAQYCYEQARECIEEARPVLEALSAKYPMMLVSNFYGNVDSVLRDFDVRRYFKGVIESAVVVGHDHKIKLRAGRMTSPDIRAGIALLIAAMSANGTSRIANIAQIDRGYEDIEQRLNQLGAKITRVSD